MRQLVHEALRRDPRGGGHPFPPVCLHVPGLSPESCTVTRRHWFPPDGGTEWLEDRKGGRVFAVLDFLSINHIEILLKQEKNNNNNCTDNQGSRKTECVAVPDTYSLISSVLFGRDE